MTNVAHNYTASIVKDKNEGAKTGQLQNRMLKLQYSKVDKPANKLIHFWNAGITTLPLQRDKESSARGAATNMNINT
jgi:hypothetical protein